MDIKEKVINSNQVLLSLSGKLTIVGIKPLKEKFLNYLDKYDLIDFELSDVNRIDSAGYQFLIFLKKEAQKKNKKLSVVKQSSAVEKILKLYNSHEYFI